VLSSGSLIVSEREVGRLLDYSVVLYLYADGYFASKPFLNDVVERF